MFVHILPHDISLSKRRLKLNHRICLCLVLFIIGYFFFCYALISSIHPRKRQSNQAPLRKIYKSKKPFLFYEKTERPGPPSQCNVIGVNVQTSNKFSDNFDVRMHKEYIREDPSKEDGDYYNLVYAMESEPHSG